MVGQEGVVLRPTPMLYNYTRFLGRIYLLQHQNMILTNIPCQPFFHNNYTFTTYKYNNNNNNNNNDNNNNNNNE